MSGPDRKRSHNPPVSIHPPPKPLPARRKPWSGAHIRHLHDAVAQVLAVISIIDTHGMHEEPGHDAVPVLPDLPDRTDQDPRRDPARRRAGWPPGRGRVTAVAPRDPARSPAPGSGRRPACPALLDVSR